MQYIFVQCRVLSLYVEIRLRFNLRLNIFTKYYYYNLYLNFMFQVVLFLKRTLSDWLFRDVLLHNPLAANHYIAHLRELSKFDELTDSLL